MMGVEVDIASDGLAQRGREGDGGFIKNWQGGHGAES